MLRYVLCYACSATFSSSFFSDASRLDVGRGNASAVALSLKTLLRGLAIDEQQQDWEGMCVTGMTMRDARTERIGDRRSKGAEGGGGRRGDALHGGTYVDD